MRPTHTKAVTLDLAQDLAIQVRRYANRTTAVLKVSNPRHASLVIGIGSGDLCAVQRLPIAVAE